MRPCLALLILPFLSLPVFAAGQETLTDCLIGAQVTVPGPVPLGTITEEKSGMCVIRLTDGEMTVTHPGLLKLAGADTQVPVDGIAALTRGYWDCAFADGGEGFSLYLAKGTYDTMEGSSSGGIISAVEGDPIGVRFADGPYDGLTGQMTGGILSFQPPGAAATAQCALRP